MMAASHMTTSHKLLLRLSLVLLVAAAVLFAIGRPLLAGCTLTAGFLAASIGVRASERLRGILPVAADKRARMISTGIKREKEAKVLAAWHAAGH